MSDALRVNVRTIAEFYTEGGDLVLVGNLMERMREGVRGHQQIQSTYGEGWEREVMLSLDLAAHGLTLHLYGRADGLCRSACPPVIEEIKTTERPLEEISECDVPAHWAQAELYGAMLARADDLSEVELRLTYLNLRGGTITFTRTHSRQTLEALLLEYTRPYAAWLSAVLGWRAVSRPSMEALDFPFEQYRDGQRSMAANVYIALRDGKRLLCQAPTGIGKTAAALYPALKALGEEKIDRIFFLTARTTGQRSAQSAVERMRRRGLIARSVTLCARDKICISPDTGCSPDTCPRARGYFDRRRTALYEALEIQDFSPEAIGTLAQKHMICPFEFSLDLSEIADVVICDYNYAFDPRVKLQRFFTGRSNAALLVDEAHNLPARARSMLSARLSHRALRDLRTHVGKESGRAHPLYKALTALLLSFKQLREEFSEETVRTGPPAELIEAVQTAAPLLGEQMYCAASWHGELTERFFELTNFLHCARAYSEDYRTILIPDGKSMSDVMLWCANPAPHLGKALSRVHGAALFSATLSPMSFYRDLCGLSEEAGDALLSLSSPFPPENLLVLHAPLPVRYRQREESLPALSRLIAAFASACRGNCMVFFPSYAYLKQAQPLIEPLLPECIRLLVQEREMDDASRAAFVDSFTPDAQSFVCGMAVLGGSFAEGIDLPDEMLCGAVIVGTGLPQIGTESSALQEVYQERFSEGYRYACMYPGIARVLQAAGRVIRTEHDRGCVLLIDSRWSDAEHRRLLPGHYRPICVSNAASLTARLTAFRSGF